MPSSSPDAGTPPDSTTITALLVDDEPRANQRMLKLLAAHPEIEVVGVAGNVAEARAVLETQPPDVVFLDVEMPGGSGLDLLVSVPDTTQVVFVTAREKYAVQAFAAAALDYLVKPVDPERLADTVARLRRQAAGTRGQPTGDRDEPGTDDLDAETPKVEVAPRSSTDDARRQADAAAVPPPRPRARPWAANIAAPPPHGRRRRRRRPSFTRLRPPIPDRAPALA